MNTSLVIGSSVAFACGLAAPRVLRGFPLAAVWGAALWALGTLLGAALLGGCGSAPQDASTSSAVTAPQCYGVIVTATPVTPDQWSQCEPWAADTAVWCCARVVVSPGTCDYTTTRADGALQCVDAQAAP